MSEETPRLWTQSEIEELITEIVSRRMGAIWPRLMEAERRQGYNAPQEDIGP